MYKLVICPLIYVGHESGKGTIVDSSSSIAIPAIRVYRHTDRELVDWIVFSVYVTISVMNKPEETKE